MGWVIKDEMQHATQCKGGEQSGMKCNLRWMNKKTWYGGDLNQKQKLS
jgi:hypothetical protein